MLSIGQIMEQSSVTYATAPKAADQVSEKKTTTLASDATDQFIRSGATFTPAYTKATVTDNRSNLTGNSTDPNSNIPPGKAEETKEQEKTEEKTRVGEHKGSVPRFTSVAQAKTEIMKDMVMQVLTGQVDNSRKTGAVGELEEILNSFSDRSEPSKDVTVWNANAAASRILEFARELAGSDDRSFGTLNNAFESAFAESERMYGGKGSLPLVSYDTYDKARKGFDDWAVQIARRRS